MVEIVCDFETASGCDVKKSGSWRYAEDPTTEVICFGYMRLNGNTSYRWTPDMGLDEDLERLAADPEVIFIAHNCAFEKAIWRRIMVALFGFSDIPNSRWQDTMAVCAMKLLPQELGHAAQVLGLEHQKDREGSAVTKALSKLNKHGYYIRTPDLLERAYVYNESDLLVTGELRGRVGVLPVGERNVWLLDQRINERGVRLDMAFVRACQAIVDRASGPLAEEFKRITGGIKFSQRDKIASWLSGEGVSLPDLRKETLDRVLGETEDGDEYVEEDDGAYTPAMPEHVHRALSIRRLIGSASVKKLARMELCVCSDGRARGLLQYHGAGPGRWAGRLLQPQNFPRGTLKAANGEAPDPRVVVEAIMTGDPSYVELFVGPPVETVVSALRHAIVSAEGRLLTAGDFSTIEARIVLALSGQHDRTAVMAAGKDIYCDMAKSIYGREIDKKKDPEERQTGKNAVLGLGFQMGWKKFKLRYAKDMDDEFCKDVVETYRKEWAPCVPRLWTALESAAIRAVHDRRPAEAYGVEYRLEDGWLTARLPSGRKLWYPNPIPTRKAMPWDADDVRPSWTYRAVKNGRPKIVDAFGGLLAENVVQGLARDLMVAGMFKAEANGFPIVLTVHDEIVTEPLARDPDALKKELEQIMADVPEWARALKIPVAASSWAGERYKK